MLKLQNTHKFILVFLGIFMCLGIASLFLNKVAADEFCYDVDGTPIHCPSGECNPALEVCGGGGTGGCYDDAGAPIDCTPPNQDPGCYDDAGAPIDCVPEENPGCFDNAGVPIDCTPPNQDPGCYDNAGAPTPCPPQQEPGCFDLNGAPCQEECDPTKEDCGDQVCLGADGSPIDCPPGGDPGCYDNAGAPIDCPQDECDPQREICDDFKPECDPSFEDCGNRGDECDPQREICDDFKPECDPSFEDCGNRGDECDPTLENCNNLNCDPKTENCDTSNRPECEGAECSNQELKLEKEPRPIILTNSTPQLHSSASEELESHTPPRLTQTGPSDWLIILIASSLSYGVWRKVESSKIKNKK